MRVRRPPLHPAATPPRGGPLHHDAARPGDGGPLRVLWLLLAPLPRGPRHRLRLRHPAAAARADAIADHADVAVLIGAGVFAAVALTPVLFPPGPRLYLLGGVVGMLTGIPYVVERRSQRRRLAQADRPRDPLPAPGATGPAADALARRDPAAALTALGPMPDPPANADLRLRALATAALGDARTARLLALRAVQVDPGAWPLLSDSGLLLCRAGRFVAGIRLLEAGLDAAEAGERSRRRDGQAPGRPAATEDLAVRQARLALVEGLRLAGRLREAVTALDGGPGPLAGTR